MDDLAFSALSRRGPRRCRLERQAVLLSSSQSTRSCLRSKSAKLQRDDLSDRWLPYDALIIVSPVQPQLALRRSRKLTSRPRCLYGNWRGLGRASAMNILLYNPDNEVTNNFMPHLWMFLLKSLTPTGHEVLLVGGNAQRMSAPELVEYARGHAIGLAGIGFMTRMAAKAYRMADARRVTPTRWCWARLTRSGPGSLPMRQTEPCGRFMRRSMTTAKKSSLPFPITRKSPGTRWTSASSTCSTAFRDSLSAASAGLA